MTDEEKKRKALEMIRKAKSTLDKTTVDKMERMYNEKFGTFQTGETGKELFKPSNDPIRVNIGTDKINTIQKVKIQDGDTFQQKISKLRALKKLGKKGVKTLAGAVPLVGGMMAGMESASAAEAKGSSPMQSALIGVASGLGEEISDYTGGVEGLGPKQGSPESVIEDPSVSQEERMAAIKMLREKYRGN